MPGEFIKTLRPDGRKGIVIGEMLYYEFSTFILSTLDNEHDYTLCSLLECAHQHFAYYLEGEVSWLIMHVKLDLQARGLIKIFIPVYSRNLHLLKLSRAGLKHLRSQKLLPKTPSHIVAEVV